MKVLHSSCELELITGGGKRCYGVNFKENGVTATYLTASFDDAPSCSRRYCGNGYNFIQLGVEKVWCEAEQELTSAQLYNTKRALKTISVNICGKVFCGDNGIFTNSYM